MSLFFIWHFVSSVLLALTFASIFGSISFATALTSLLCGAFISYFLARADAPSKTIFFDPQKRSIEVLWLERIAVVIAAYLSFRHFLFLFYEAGSEFKTLNPNNYGDLPLHINYIRHIAGGASFPWINPSYSLDLLRYPIGADLYNALWEAVGVRLPAHLFLVGIVGCGLIIRLVRILASWWGVIGLFLGCGLIGVPQAELAWKSLFLSVLVTQRGFLFALPIGIYLILRARRAERLSWTFGVLWGALAVFHLHSFAIVSLILIGESLVRREPKKLLRCLPVAVPLGSAFVFHSVLGLNSTSFVRFQWGWMSEGSLLYFLNINFGPYLYLVVFALIALLAKYPRHFFTRLFLFHLSLFLVFMNVIVAPWAWDNIKILLWPYLLILAVFALVSDQIKVPGFQTALALVLGFSGLLAVAPSLTSTAGALSLYNKGELANLETVLRKIPRNSIFLAATTHHHPLTYFGQARAVGYAGHLWSHGISASDAQTKLERIFNDDPAWRDLARELRVTHIYWGKDERSNYGSKLRSWQIPQNNISTVEDIAVYEVK